jgi:hypothetical protein
VAQRLNDLAKEYRATQRGLDDEAGYADAFEVVNFQNFYPNWTIR